MKTFVKILSMLIAIVMIVSVGVVGMSAYAANTDYFGDYDFTVVDNPYEDIDWGGENVHAFKSSTHAHTVRSDADIELNDTIWYHYMKGYEVLCLTDHGTVNGVDIKENGKTYGANGANGVACGWTRSQDRCALYGYQSFVHGNIDEITDTDYINIINGFQDGSRPTQLVAENRGMYNLPLGNECNGMSSNKCHVNTYHISFGHGANRSPSWPESTVQESYDVGGYSHINHVGEWSEGNDSALVYNADWISRYVSIFEKYCPNRNYTAEEASKWETHDLVTGETVLRGVIGMELVNTSDNRTRNDRRYVYDECLKILAPQGINMWGFCEDDSHEESDVDNNAQYYIVNDGTAQSAYDEAYFDTKYGAGASHGYTGDIRHSMTNGEFYASSVNSKNSYELGDGFNAAGDYPSIDNFVIDESKDQIILSVNNSAKVRLVADGVIIDTKTITETDEFQTVVFDLNQFEDHINSYVRIYMTGKGGITYLQPVLLSKTQNKTAHVQFILPAADTKLSVADANGNPVTTEYNDNIFVLDAGTYTYTASRKGYKEKKESFTVTQEMINAGERLEIKVELEQDENASLTFFYAPETIYLNPANGREFQYYVDRENRDNGDLIVNPAKTDGNLYFHRAGASNVKITYSVQEGDADIESMAIENATAVGEMVSTKITGGLLDTALNNDQYVLIVWDASYTFNGKILHSYTYSYVYRTPVPTNATLSAGVRVRIKGPYNSPMYVVATAYAYGLHEINSSSANGYEYAPYTGATLNGGYDNDPYVNGSAMTWGSAVESSGGSRDATVTSEIGYIYADRSRINGFQDVPYFQVGFDLNTSEEANRYSGSDVPTASLTFDESLSLGSTTFTTDLQAHTGKQLYRVGNYNGNRFPTYKFKSGEDVEYKAVGYVKGYKEITDTIAWKKYIAHASVTSTLLIHVVSVNKSNLREKLISSINDSYQPDWFASTDEYDSYRKEIIAAAKVLGDPTATLSEISNAFQNVENIENSIQLKKGTAQVHHYWKYTTSDGVTTTKLIKSEDGFTFTYSDTLVANSTIIPGYDYKEEYVCYVDDAEKPSYSGTSEFVVLTASSKSYDFIFYYEPAQYTVTYYTGTADFVPNSGTGRYAHYGQNYIVTSNAPTRTGYTFDGWYLDIDPTFKVYSAGDTFKYDYMEAGQFNAKWVPLEYKVSFDPNGGKFDEGQEPKGDELDVEFDEVYKMPMGVPHKTGYNFTGWQLNGNEIYTAGGQLLWDFAADGKFVAHWSNAVYNVTFDPLADDATLDITEKAVTYDQAYGTLPTPVRTGYTHKWYSNPGPDFPETALVDSSTIVKIAADHKLYADWSTVDYNISYTLDGGEVIGKNPTTYTIESDEFTLKNPERVGYEFIGWSGTDLDPTKYHKVVTVSTGEYGDRTYVAHWKAYDYEIKYDLNDGDSDIKAKNNPNNPTTYTYADEIVINPPTRTGYEFKGWSDNKGNYKNVLVVTIPAGRYTEELTFQASWELINYTIEYNLADGAIDAADGSNKTMYTIEDESFTLINPKRTGYRFFGWQSNYFTDTRNTVTVEKGSYGNKKFTAVWASLDNYVTYDLAGGSVDATNPAEFKTGSYHELVNPTKLGYTFNGWYKTIINADGTPGATVAQGLIGTINKDDASDLKFTATWVANTYDINYVLNGGRFETYASNPNPTTYTPDSRAITLVNPIKAGYRFAGWSGTGFGGMSTSVTIQTGSIDDRTYTANWDLVTYNISYDFNGGASAGALLNQYNVSTNTVIEDPIRPGCAFTGWNQEFHNFTWKSGYLDAATGLLVKSESYPDSVLSSPIFLKAGESYKFKSALGLTDIDVYTFSVDGVFTGAQAATESFVPSQNCYAYIVAKSGHNDPAIQDTVKIEVVGLQEEIEIVAGSTGNFKITANWELVTYDITYDLDGGYFPQYDKDGNELVSGDEGYVENYNPNPSTYNTEESDIVLSNPVKPGYNFIGWYDGRSTSTLAVVTKGSTGDINFRAMWMETTYSINYSLNGGVVEGNPSSYTYNTESFTLNNPTRTGYTFDGWTGTGISGVSKEVTVEKHSTGNRTFAATWTPVTYTITYNMNGGVNAESNPRSYTIEDTITLAQPTKIGATFAGWTGDSIDGTSKTVVIAAGSTGNLVFNATWDLSSFDITYNLDGGAYYNDQGVVVENPNPSEYSVDSYPIVLKNPSKAGYTFLGWTGANLNSITEHVTIPTGSTGSRNYIANWQVINYNINYVIGDGAQVGIPNPTSYNFETPTFTLNNPVRSGYTFDGWIGTGISDDDPQLSVTISKGTYGNRSYTAVWTIDKFDIFYNLNDGILTAANPSSYTINSNPITLNNPTRLGFIFKGWSGTGITGNGISQTVIIPTGSTGDRAYTANWELETYTITYEFNGGSETVANPRTYNYLSSPITLYPPQNPGYTFLGWESDYYEGAVTNVTIPTNSTGHKVFVATWELGVYNITYDLDGGTADNPTTYEYATETFQLNEPTKKGYNFVGWSGTDISGTSKEVYIFKYSTGDRHYVANWAEESANSISYNLNGGSVAEGENPTSYVTNSGILTLTNPTRRGFRFTGWTGTNVDTLTKVVDIDTSLGIDLEFTAHWEAVEYNITYTLDGGSVDTANRTKYTVADQFTLNNPVRTGYEFKGWIGTGIDSAYPQLAVTVMAGSIGNRRYTAVWAEKVYNIEYDLGEGSVTPANPPTYTYSSETITLNNPTRTGYTFAGWTEAEYYPTATLLATIPRGSLGDRHFVAHYTLNTYTVTYLGLNGASFAGAKTEYNTTMEFAIPNPTKIGYNFSGWEGTGIIGLGKDVVVPVGSSGNRTYTANWAPVKYTIAYDLAGGRVSGINPTSYTIESNNASILNPGRAGFSFAGWQINLVDFVWFAGSIDSATGNVVAGNGYYSMPVTLRGGTTYNYDSSLRLAIYDLTGNFVALVNSGSYTPAEDCICSVVAADATADSLAAIKVAISGNAKDVSIPKGSMGSFELIAKWSAEEFAITYNLNGGYYAQGVTNPTTYTPDDSFALNNPSKTGYKFLGWTGTGLNSAQSSVFITEGSSGNRTYTANWRLETYQLDINLDGGTFAESVPSEFTVNTDTITLPVPRKSGFTFAGWRLADDTVVESVTIVKGSTGNRSYTAVWIENTANTHKIYFYGYRGEFIGNFEVQIGSLITPPSPTVVVGYQFSGWNVDLSSFDIINSTEDIYVNATYKVGPETYTININGTEKVYNQYAKVSAEAPATDSNGNSFSHWVDENGNIASFYRSFSFNAHSNGTLTPVYTSTSAVKVATRITKAEYNAQYKWITFYADRSISSEYTVIQHGIMFTDNLDVAKNADAFQIGKDNVYVGTATGKNRSGVYTLSIGTLQNYDAKLYGRSYAIVADANGTKYTVYSEIPTVYRDSVNVYNNVLSSK